MKTVGKGLIKDYDSVTRDFIDTLTHMQSEFINGAVISTEVNIYRILNIVENIGENACTPTIQWSS